MSDAKRERLVRLRETTAYPGVRSTVAAVSRLLKWVAVLLLGAGIAGLVQEDDLRAGLVILAGLALYAMIVWISARLITGLAMVLIDIADGLLERCDDD